MIAETNCFMIVLLLLLSIASIRRFLGEGEGDNFVSSIFLIKFLHGRKFEVTKENVFLHFGRLKKKSDFPGMSW